MLPKLAGLLLAGNLLMGRSFAYWGIQQAKLFVGDAFLAAFALWRPSAVFGIWLKCLGTDHVASPFAWALAVTMFYGLFEFVRGVVAGYSALYAAQNLVLNFYPLYFFVGAWVGLRNASLIRSFARPFAWVHGVYGVAYILFLNRFDIAIPGAPWVALFGQPSGAAIAMVALLSFESRVRVVLVPLLLNAFVLLGMQVRAEWLAFLVGVTVWSVTTGKVADLVRIACVVPALLIVGFIVDFEIPGTSERGGVISSRGLIGRALAPVDERLAEDLMGRHARSAAATFNWRAEWWKDIWRVVHEDTATTALGLGYGFPLASVTTVPMPGVKEAPVRTPHSIFYYTLGYSGWIGVVLFFYFQLQLFALLWRGYKLSGQAFGLAACAGLLAWAFFDAAFETPYRAIPFFLIAGTSTAPVFAKRAWVRIAVRAQGLQGPDPETLAVGQRGY